MPEAGPARPLPLSPDFILKEADMAEKYTTSFGVPVQDDTTSQTAGAHGPLLMQDVHLVEKLSHFDRERIPERVVHAKGAGAFGVFECTEDMSRYTCAHFLGEAGRRTPMLARFSTVQSERGGADTIRDPRGFALKFYTEEGNYDLVGNNTPVFFIRDPLKFPDFIHTQKAQPGTGLRNMTSAWDFWSLTPEALHQVTILFSDRGIPASYRHMHGFGSHTFMWYNEHGEYVWVKYHMLTRQGIANLNAEDAVRVAGEDPDAHRRDLWEAIEKGEYPQWDVYVQICKPEELTKFPFDSFDLTKVWPHAQAPLRKIGVFTLTRNPDNFFAQIEQAAFNPSNFAPGIGPSPDRMLQGRLFSYHDTHLHRLGANYHLIPVNAPLSGAHTYQADGPMRVDDNNRNAPNYWPNSFGGPQPQGRPLPPLALEGAAALHPYELSDEDFAQPRALYGRVMGDPERELFIHNVALGMEGVPSRIKARMTALFWKMDADAGRRIADAVQLDAARVEELAAMTQDERVAATAK